MKTSLHTKSQQGYLDFLSGIICFENREKRDIPFIESALKAQGSVTLEQAEIRSLLAHEATHLLDLLTTNWGLEYIHRKNRAYMAMESMDFEGRLSVFMLNTAEIESHDELKKTYSDASLNTATKITHGLIRDERFGPMIIVNYVANDKIIHQTPLSMLSLLEAHATSEEFLSRINDARNSERLPIDLELVKADFKRLLGDKELSEYSLLLYLTELHFKEFISFENILKLVSSLSRISLDFPSMSCASFGTSIRDTFLDKVTGYDVSMDLCRGMSRQIIFFKTILLMYSWLKEGPEKDRGIILDLLDRDSIGAIIKFFEITEVNYNKIWSDSEFNCALNNIPCESPLPDKAYAHDVSKANRDLLSGSCLANKLLLVSLPQILLGDDSEVYPANAIATEHMQFVKDNIEIYTKLDSMYKKNKHKKFHPPSGAGLDFFGIKSYATTI